MNYRHLVLFTVHDGVPDAVVDGAVSALRALGGLPMIDTWHVAWSLDERKGRVIVEDATFADEAAFEAFREHPDHALVGRMMAGIADWVVGDYVA